MIRNHSATSPRDALASPPFPLSRSPVPSPVISRVLASVFDGKHEGFAAPRDAFLEAGARNQLSRRRAGETLARMRDAGLLRIADAPRAYLLTDAGRVLVHDYFAAARGDDAGVPSSEWVEED